jgi:magnesium chelatase subunit I
MRHMDSKPIVDQVPDEQPAERVGHTFRSLNDLLAYVSGKSLSPSPLEEDAGLAEPLPFPFLAIVGQQEMKLALLLGLINPAIGGILLIGPRGTAKTTAVRSLLDILPKVSRSLCHYGCLPEDIEAGGIDAVCPDCAKKYAENLPLTGDDRVRLIELPLNARLEDVVGGIDDRNPRSEQHKLRRGILSQADRNLLYIDEINLLPDEIVDAILDAAAQGSYTVRRGPVSATLRARFVLIGSMNPEEGKLRPQILDRFGLRVIVRGLKNNTDRLEAYHRVQAYINNPRFVSIAYGDELVSAAKEIQTARMKLARVTISDRVAKSAIKLVQQMEIDSLRAEITWFEAARAYAAADGRLTVRSSDLRAVAPMALRLRRSEFMAGFFELQEKEEKEMERLIKALGN